MIVEEYLPEIRASMKLFLKNTINKIDKANIEQLIRITKRSKMIYGYFKFVLEPNKYMIIVMEHLVTFGAGSATTIAEAELERDPEAKPKDTSLENFQGSFRKQASYMKKLKIITYEILSYTSPSPTTMYKRYDCTEEQFLDAIEEKYKKYEDYIRRAEKVIEYKYTKDQTPEKVIEYKHTKDQTPEKAKPKKAPKRLASDNYKVREEFVQKQICRLCNNELDNHDWVKCDNPEWKLIEV